MTESEYEELKQTLLSKRLCNKHSCLTNREQGYDEGIEVAVSKIRELYRRNSNVRN